MLVQYLKYSIKTKYFAKHQPLQVKNCTNFTKDEYLVRIDVKPLENITLVMMQQKSSLDKEK